MGNSKFQKGDYECNIFSIKADGILRELNKMARKAFRLGYGTTELLFSDWSLVSRTEWDAISRIEALLRAGHQPLGFIAPDRDRKRNPFVEPWETGDLAALAQLAYLAWSVYWHLLPARNAQQNIAADEDERTP